MKQEITVQLTLEWTFTDREWSKEKQHIEDLKNIPSVILGNDTINTIFMLNDIKYPELKNCKVKTV
jgi:hypothetical protein|tara:strand:- start:61 stop:258 length:198 start_codon:yes stop_codon:yes gene_type:complete